MTRTTALRSYVFRASQQLTGGPTIQQSTLTGQANRPSAVSYQLTAGGQTQQVIGVAGHTYARVPPGSWKALTTPSSTVDPVASLLPLLTELAEPVLIGPTLSGMVPASVLSAAGLAPTGTTSSAAPTPVTFTLDAAGRVSAVTVRLVVKAGAKTLTVTQVTTFSLFNAAPVISAPSVAS